MEGKNAIAQPQEEAKPTNKDESGENLSPSDNSRKISNELISIRKTLGKTGGISKIVDKTLLGLFDSLSSDKYNIFVNEKIKEDFKKLSKKKGGLINEKINELIKEIKDKNKELETFKESSSGTEKTVNEQQKGILAEIEKLVGEISTKKDKETKETLKNLKNASETLKSIYNNISDGKGNKEKAKKMKNKIKELENMFDSIDKGDVKDRIDEFEKLGKISSNFDFGKETIETKKIEGFGLVELGSKDDKTMKLNENFLTEEANTEITSGSLKSPSYKICDKLWRPLKKTEKGWYKIKLPKLINTTMETIEMVDAEISGIAINNQNEIVFRDVKIKSDVPVDKSQVKLFLTAEYPVKGVDSLEDVVVKHKKELKIDINSGIRENNDIIGDKIKEASKGLYETLNISENIFEDSELNRYIKNLDLSNSISENSFLKELKDGNLKKWLKKLGKKITKFDNDQTQSNNSKRKFRNLYMKQKDTEALDDRISEAIAKNPNQNIANLFNKNLDIKDIYIQQYFKNVFSKLSEENPNHNKIKNLILNFDWATTDENAKKTVIENIKKLYIKGHKDKFEKNYGIKTRGSLRMPFTKEGFKLLNRPDSNFYNFVYSGGNEVNLSNQQIPTGNGMFENYTISSNFLEKTGKLKIKIGRIGEKTGNEEFFELPVFNDHRQAIDFLIKSDNKLLEKNLKIDNLTDSDKFKIKLKCSYLILKSLIVGAKDRGVKLETREEQTNGKIVFKGFSVKSDGSILYYEKDEMGKDILTYSEDNLYGKISSGDLPESSRILNKIMLYLNKSMNSFDKIHRKNTILPFAPVLGVKSQFFRPYNSITRRINNIWSRNDVNQYFTVDMDSENTIEFKEDKFTLLKQKNDYTDKNETLKMKNGSELKIENGEVFIRKMTTDTSGLEGGKKIRAKLSADESIKKLSDKESKVKMYFNKKVKYYTLENGDKLRIAREKNGNGERKMTSIKSYKKLYSSAFFGDVINKLDDRSKSHFSNKTSINEKFFGSFFQKLIELDNKRVSRGRFFVKDKMTGKLIILDLTEGKPIFYRSNASFEEFQFKLKYGRLKEKARYQKIGKTPSELTELLLDEKYFKKIESESEVYSSTPNCISLSNAIYESMGGSFGMDALGRKTKLFPEELKNYLKNKENFLIPNNNSNMNEGMNEGNKQLTKNLVEIKTVDGKKFYKPDIENLLKMTDLGLEENDILELDDTLKNIQNGNSRTELELLQKLLEQKAKTDKANKEEKNQIKINELKNSELDSKENSQEIEQNIQMKERLNELKIYSLSLHSFWIELSKNEQYKTAIKKTNLNISDFHKNILFFINKFNVIRKEMEPELEKNKDDIDSQNILLSKGLGKIQEVLKKFEVEHEKYKKIINQSKLGIMFSEAMEKIKDFIRKFNKKNIKDNDISK